MCWTSFIASWLLFLPWPHPLIVGLGLFMAGDELCLPLVGCHVVVAIGGWCGSGGFSLLLVGHGCGPSLLFMLMHCCGPSLPLQTWTEQKIIEDAAIKKLCQAFRTLNLGEGKAEQVDQVLSAISKMTKLDPSTLEFEDNPRTWEEAEQSVDTKCWEKKVTEMSSSLWKIWMSTNWFPDEPLFPSHLQLIPWFESDCFNG